MQHRTGLWLFFAVVGAAACGGPSGNDFSNPGTKAGASGTASASGGSSSGGTSAAQGGGGTSGGSGGTHAAGGAGGTSADAGGTSGDTGGSGADGGSGGGLDTGGTGGSGMEVGGAAGSGADAGGTAGGGGMSTGGMGGSDASGGSAGMGAMGGKGSSDCSVLQTQYAAALAEAEACNPAIDREQCTETMPSSLRCGCAVPVNPDNKSALQKLRDLQKQGASCMLVCPAIACVAPGPPVCMPAATDTNPDAGRCMAGALTAN